MFQPCGFPSCLDACLAFVNTDEAEHEATHDGHVLGAVIGAAAREIVLELTHPVTVHSIGEPVDVESSRRDVEQLFQPLSSITADHPERLRKSHRSQSSVSRCASGSQSAESVGGMGDGCSTRARSPEPRHRGLRPVIGSLCGPAVRRDVRARRAARRRFAGTTPGISISRPFPGFETA